MEQIERDIVPYPNLDILPSEYHHYYPKYFANGRIIPGLKELLKNFENEMVTTFGRCFYRV